jgi:hypothetical protein
MTKREKILVIIGVTFLILFGAGNYLIIPAYNDYVEKSESVLELRFSKMETEMKLDSKPSVVVVQENMRERYHALAAQFQGRLTSYEIDNLFTGILMQHDIDPISLSFNTVESEGAVSSELVRVSAVADYWSIQRLINMINNTDYIYISYFNYTVRDGWLAVDIDFNVQMLDKSVV